MWGKWGSAQSMHLLKETSKEKEGIGRNQAGARRFVCKRSNEGNMQSADSLPLGCWKPPLSLECARL